ncbi:hypothetical protein MNBD_BACTEROID06-751, partial [hydrothermal vent metagenome]
HHLKLILVYLKKRLDIKIKSIYLYSMKKLAVVLAFVVLVFASSCTSYTCPTYAKVDVEKNNAMPEEAL